MESTSSSNMGVSVCLQWQYNSISHTITSKLDGKCVDGSSYGTSDGTNVQVRGIHIPSQPNYLTSYSNGIVVEQTTRRLAPQIATLNL